MGRAAIMHTASRNWINLADLKVEDIKLHDIGWSLAKQDRYTGHAPVHISVAQHVCEVSYLLKVWGYPLSVQREGFAHDFSEAYIGDVGSPLKRMAFMREYEEFENNVIWPIIAARFRLPKVRHPAVKKADSAMWKCEVRDLWGEDPMQDPWWAGEPAPEDFAIDRAWGYEEAYKRFMQRAGVLNL